MPPSPTTPGTAPISLDSSAPITQVKWLSGQACCRVRSTGTTWQVSPMADSLSMQMFCGVEMGLGMERV